MRKKLLAILLVLCMTLCLLPTAALAEESSFTDVEGHWAVDSIDRWAGYNVLNGKDESTFDPEGKMTRAEFAQMLVNLMGYTETSDQTFTDMTGHWAADAISKLVKAGVMNGMGDGTMDPDGKITREMAAVMLCRAFNLKPSKDASLTFADSANVSSWAKDAMVALSERDMIGGIGNNLLSPEGIVNRATAAKLADNMIGEYVTEDKVITGEVKGIVLVVNGAKAEIKDATLSAPVVVKDSTAVLTNTKADDVVADGGSVTADAKTTVANVTLTGDAPVAKLDGKVEGSVSASGTKPQVEVKGDIAGEVTIGGSDAKVDLKGEVAGGVTVAEDATGKPQVTAPKGTEVKNESETDATVNGSKVEAGGETTTTTTPSTPSTGDTGTTTPSTPAHEHVWDDGVVTKPATCTTKGVKTFTCTAEGCTDPKATKTEELAATGHTYSEENDGWTVKTAATCASTGVKTRTCTTCSAVETGTIPKTTEHTYGTTPVMISATEHKYTCSVCGNVKTEAHDNKGTGGACTCGYKETVTPGEEITGHTEHTFSTEGTVKTQPTCSTEGVMEYKCTYTSTADDGTETKCTATKTVPIAKLPHTWNTEAEGADAEGWVLKTAGTCTTAAKYERTCKNEGCTVKETKDGDLDPNKHTEVDIEAKPATCTESGNAAGKKCSACNVVISGGTVIAPLGHKWGAWDSATGTRTCQNDPKHTETCEHKNAVEVASTAKAATCTAAGKSADTVCPVCGKVTKEGTAIDALGHDMKDVAGSAKAPTCTEAGKAVDKKCSRCDHAETGAAIPATGHKDMTTWHKDDTKHWHECSVCHTKTNEATHTYTAGEDGKKTCECGAEEPTQTTTEYTITVANVTNGTVATNPNGKAAENAEVIVTVTPATGYQIKSVSYTSEGSTESKTVTESNGKYTFAMPAANVTVTAEFELIPTYTLTINSVETTDGSVSVKVGDAAFTSGSKTPAGKTVALTINAAEGKTIASVKYTEGTNTTAKDATKDTDNSGDNGDVYTFTMPAADVTVTVTFEDAGATG